MLLISEYSVVKQDWNQIIDLFKSAKIIGVIHQHHHLLATKGRDKFVQFTGRKMFGICWIYSQLNLANELCNSY